MWKRRKKQEKNAETNDFFFVENHKKKVDERWGKKWKMRISGKTEK